jgi:hypothetical protein
VVKSLVTTIVRYVLSHKWITATNHISKCMPVTEIDNSQ